MASLHGQFSVVNRAIVVHAMEDDLGRGGDDESLKTGNAGCLLVRCPSQMMVLMIAST